MAATITRERVEEVLGHIRPALQRDGGDVELMDVAEDGTVTVRLQGACRGCPMAQLTLQMGIEARLKEEIDDSITVVPAQE